MDKKLYKTVKCTDQQFAFRDSFRDGGQIISVQGGALQPASVQCNTKEKQCNAVQRSAVYRNEVLYSAVRWLGMLQHIFLWHCINLPAAGYKALHTAHYMMNTAHYMMNIAHFIMNTAHWMMQILQYTLNMAYCTLHTSHYTLHIAHRKQHTAHCTLHTAHCNQGPYPGLPDPVSASQWSTLWYKSCIFLACTSELYCRVNWPP